jgi:hypothetical protein
MIHGFSGDMRKQKRLLLVWVFAFRAHTLAATDWLVTLIGYTTCGLYMIPECSIVLIFTVYTW